MSLEITKICRTCLALEGALLSIYDSKGSSGGGGCVADMLGDLTNNPPKPFDGMPEKVCLTCISEINRCYSFKMKCDNSDRTLRQLLNITEEPEDPDEPHDDVKLKPEVINPIELIDEKAKPPKRKAETNFRILNQEEETMPSQSTEIYTMRAEEEAAYFVIPSDDDENQGSHDKNETQDEGNSEDYDEILQKFVHQSQENEEEDEKEEEEKEEEGKDEEEREDEQDGEYKPTTRLKIARTKVELSCPMCPMRFVHPRNLTKHMKRHHNVNEGAESSGEQQSVTVTVTEAEEVAEAVEQHEDFEVDFQPIESTEINIAEEPKEIVAAQKHRCPRCRAGFAHLKSLNIHMKQNKCTKKQYSCAKCHKVFISPENLRAHVRTHKEEFPCGICGQVFSQEDELNEHKADKHNLKMRNQCPSCKKVFTMLSTLKDHMRIHSGEKPFLCSICGKGFSQNANLKQHVMRHNKTKPYKCEECSRSFVSKGELYSHLRSHTGDHPFVCDICKTAFTTSSSLVKHKRIHTGERPYGCEFCPMRFTALNTLKNHRRTHTGEKPYKCQYCQRGFAQKSDCAIHMRTHTGERRYVCQVCGSAFQQSGTLRTHMKTHIDLKDSEVLSQDEDDEAEQSSNVVEMIDVEMNQDRHDGKYKKATTSVKVGVELVDDELLHFAIEECSSEMNDFAGE